MIAKSEWRGGDQKKMEKMEFDMPTCTYTNNKKKEIMQTMEKSILMVCLLPASSDFHQKEQPTK